MKNALNRREFLKLLGLLPLGFVSPTSSLENMTGSGDTKNILIIVLDALSAYHLSIHGYARETMPNLNRLADRAIVYHNHYSGGNYTTPGTASLLTGNLPWNHRAIVFNDTVAEEFVTRNIFSVFSSHFRMAYSHNPLVNTQLRQFLDDIDDYTPREKLFLDTDKLVNSVFSTDEDIASVSWIRALKKSDGYSYALFLPFIKEFIKKYRIRGLENGYPRGLPYINVDDYYILDQGIDYLIQKVSEVPRPFLSYYHFLPPHAPYNPSEEFIGVFNNDGNDVIDKGRNVFSRKKTIEELNEQNTHYDEFILNADHAFARLFDSLDKLGILDTTWLIVTSDHGELFERGILGHLTPVLHQPIIKIPLFIFEPSRHSRLDIYENTSSVDILPTLLQLNGKKIPDWIEGQVLPPFVGNHQEELRDIFALQAKGIGKEDPIVKASVMLVKGSYKMMYYFGYRELEVSTPLIELYDLEHDPQELNNLYPTNRMVAREFIDTIERKIKEINEPYQ